MPVIREYGAQLSPGERVNQRYASGADFGGQISDSLQTLGDAITRISSHIAEVRQDTRVTAASTQAAGELQSYADYLQNGRLNPDGQIEPAPDPGEHYPLFQAKAKEISERVKNELGDGQTYTKFNQQFSGLVLREGLSVQQKALDRQKSMAAVELDTTADDLISLAARSDEITKGLIVEQLNATVGRYVAAGVFTPEQAKQRTDKFAHKLDVAQVREDIRKDPGVALASLLQGGYKSLDPVEEQKWIDIAAKESERQTKAMVAAQEQARIQEERAQRQMEEDTAKAAASLSARGELTVPWVEAVRDQLSKNDYELYLGIASGKTPSKRNELIFSDLFLRAVDGKNVLREAKAALRRGDIRPEDYSSLERKVKGEADDGAKLPDNYKAGLAYIKETLGPDELNLQAGDRQRRAEAIRRWDNWVRANPGASSTEHQKEAQAIAEQALGIERTQVGRLYPRYKVGNSNTREELSASWQRTKEAFERGEITRDVYNSEAELIRERLKYAKDKEGAK